MNVNKQMALVVGVFVVGVLGGVMLGMGYGKKAAGTMPPPPSHESPQKRLAVDLGLSEEQQAKQKAIWDGVGETMQKYDEKRHQIDKERDDAVAALFSAEQKAAYDKILTNQAKQKEDLSKERDAAFAKSQEDFKAILDDVQKAKYEQMLKERPPRGGRDGRGGRGGPRTGPATTPAASGPATNK